MNLVLEKVKSRSSSLHFLLRKLEKISDSQEFCYRLDFDQFQNNKSQRGSKTPVTQLSHVFVSKSIQNLTKTLILLDFQSEREMKTLGIRVEKCLFAVLTMLLQW